MQNFFMGVISPFFDWGGFYNRLAVGGGCVTPKSPISGTSGGDET
jgi:hypothetical protein